MLLLHIATVSALITETVSALITEVMFAVIFAGMN